MKPQIHSICLLLWLSLIAIESHAQALPDTTLRKIDSLFKQWDKNGSPGCAVGIIRNDSLIFAKGYGAANLEYGIPIKPNTVFHVASVSKQFTAFAIVLLVKQGKLQLEDDVRKYLPWFPDLKEKITVRQLLNHTSGIRDQWQLLAISGTRLDDVITQDHIIKILSKQRALNSKPGERYNYSNSGFTMLAEIVKSVSGQTLRQFTDSAIFKPLGMINTHFHDDYTEIVKNRAYSYNRTDSAHYTNSILSYSNVGATSLFTTVEDMSKWMMNFYTHKVGDQKDIDLLTQKAKLNNGREIDYALGIGTGSYKGWKQIGHGGADAGYRTVVNVFPDLKMGVVVFSNLGDVNPGRKATEIADLFISDTTRNSVAKEDKKPDSTTAILRNGSAAKQFAGNYVSDEGMQMNFEVSNNKLYARAYGQQELLKVDRDTFTLFRDPNLKFRFKVNAPGDTAVVFIFPPDGKQELKKYDTTTLSAQALAAYTGTYYCPELDCKYGIALKGRQLVLTNTKYEDIPLNMAGPDQLLSTVWWMGNLKIVRNNNQIAGFEMNSGRILHLRFDRLPAANE